jgi:chaperonin GroEL (HSP60 family)
MNAHSQHWKNSKLATEMRKNQAERTFKVLSAVQRSGLVAGAGAAYVHCQAAIRQAAAERDLDEDARLGMRVLADALSAPMRRLLNAEVEPQRRHQRDRRRAQATYGWAQQKVVDAHAAGVGATDVLVTVRNRHQRRHDGALDRRHRLPQKHNRPGRSCSCLARPPIADLILGGRSLTQRTACSHPV